MQQVLSTISFITAHLSEVIMAVSALVLGVIAVLNALISIFILIPGAQPEAALQKAVDFLQGGVDLIAKYSKK